MTCTIAPARPDEFLHVAALDRLAWPSVPDTFIPDGEHIWRIWCDFAMLLVARLDANAALPETGRVAGALVMFPTQQGELCLHKIMVHPDCRGMGIGSDLMRRALEIAAAPVLLTVDPVNESAVALYRKFGFEIRERIDGYYRPHEDRLIMVFTPAK
jgi:ribosomal protein S18 acetylase RimI-like enzyme